MNQPVPITADRAPAHATAAGERTAYRFLDLLENLISTIFEELQIGPLCPRPVL
jgi:hypothetical protein